MVSIRGPKSALTDFIEEYGIKVKNTGKPRKPSAKVQAVARKRLKKKDIYTSQPVEISNIDGVVACAEDVLMDKISKDPYLYDLSDEDLESFSAYLSRNRIMSQYFFEYISSKAKDALVVYDCSMIPDEMFKMIKKGLKKLELHFCGQLSSETLSLVLEDASSMEILRITGAYLVDRIDFPRQLRVIDLSHCSRLENKVIDKINDTFDSLEELRLSFCYGLDDRCQLKIRVDRLYLCETRVGSSFLATARDIEHVSELSLKRCINVDNIDGFNFTRIRKLDIEGITSISTLRLPDTIEDLNISYCYNIRDFYHPNLRHLNLSYLDLRREEVLRISELKKLECLNVSWCKNIDDGVISILLTLENINTIYVFGCFGLSSSTAEAAWSLREKIKLVGNPSETNFLLHR